MINPVELFSDTRAVLGTAVAMLGLAFIRYGMSRRTPAVTWLALSSAYYGLGQLLMRVIEMGWEVGNPLDGWLGIGIGLPALSGFVAGTTTLLMRGHSGWIAFSLVLAGTPALFIALRALLGPVPYLWQSLVALLFVVLAAWGMVGNRDIERSARVGLALILLLYPIALLYAIVSPLAVQDFRKLAIVAVSLKFFYLMTLILKSDARLLLTELRRREEAQQELRDLTGTLEEKVQLRTQQLQALNQGLRSFAGMVSHDLRGPVRNIAGLANVASESIEGHDIQGARSAISRIESEARRASDMTTDLLALASADQGMIRREWVDMQTLVANVIDELGLQYPTALTCVSAQGLPSVFADRDLMSHVLTNLISNALKFGRGRNDLSVQVSASRQDGSWRFDVSDNGPGFEATAADQLFKPFSRLGQRDVPGTGLGLTVVHRVVQAHGGAVGASATPGKGASFWWTLPLESPAVG